MSTELKTLQEAKDHGARHAGYKNWDDMFDLLGAHTLSSAKYSQVNVAIEAAMEYCYEQGLKANPIMDWQKLDILFQNNFDCYAEGGCDRMAMTFDRFVEVVAKIIPPVQNINNK